MKGQEEEVKKDAKISGGRAKETLFRVSVRNQIELIAIADNKANIITGINVIIISLIIYFVGAEFTIGAAPVTSNIELMVPFVILTFTSLTSAIFAVLAAKPKIVKGGRAGASSKLFFQSYYTETQEEYIEEMFEMISDRQRIYKNLIMDMYNNGIVLHRKYDLLQKSYNIFMYGLVGATMAFMILMGVRLVG